MQNRKIPATVISGFLGAGKTSLIQHVLSTANGRRIALIINEFGDLGIDEALLRGCDEESCKDNEIIELANGCICCTVADDFIPSMKKLLELQFIPDHIVIETSGLALPKPLVSAFNWPEIRNQVTVDGVVAVVDGPALLDGHFASNPDAIQAQRAEDPMLDHESPLEEVFEDQLSCADIVILNKMDQLLPEKQKETAELLACRLRPGVKLIPTEKARINADVLLGLDAKAEEDLISRPSHHDDTDGEHDHDEFDSFVLALDAITNPEEIQKRIATVIKEYGILRIKGFLDIADKSRRLVIQAVGIRIDSYYDREWELNEVRASRLVIIGLNPLDRPAISAKLAK